MGLEDKGVTNASTPTENVRPSAWPSTSGCTRNTNSTNNAASTSTPESNNTIESTACLVSPASIHIRHMYVYNFSPDQIDSTIKKATLKFQSPAASSGPICRICHEGDSKEDLFSPCRCAGTVGLVHITCMERWLSTRSSRNDKCEICDYTFATVRSPKSFLEWFRSDENDANNRRSLLGDLTCFLLLTPLAIVSSFLCVEGAKRQVTWGNSLEAGCLMALATFLITIYFVWSILTFRYHMRNYLRWRERNQNVKLVRVQRLSAATDDARNNLRGVRVANEAPENRTVVVSIPQSSETQNLPSTSISAPCTHVSEQVFYSSADFGYWDFYSHVSRSLEISV